MKPEEILEVLNHGSRSELIALPMIDDDLAGAIQYFRDENHRDVPTFPTLESVKRVHGISAGIVREWEHPSGGEYAGPFAEGQAG